jgi:hypothetical protein
MRVYAVVDDSLSPTFPLGDALRSTCDARTWSGSFEEVRSDEPELAT